MSAPISTLRAKLRKRKAQRKKQLALFKKTGKRGHRRAAGIHGRAARRLADLIEKAKLRQPKSGTGKLHGTRAIINNEVIPVAKKYGAPVTSRKRAATHPLSRANPGSDHNAAVKTADAVDFGTYSGDGLARAIARNLGISNYTTGNYSAYYIKRNARSYRVQILWAVSGHYDHVHVGVKLA
jgi:hypothetical protein